MKSPTRKRLPHTVPLWVDPVEECYFVTICCKKRGENQLCFRALTDALFETIEHRNDTAAWYVYVGLVMPDHIHLLVSFPQSNKRIQTIVSKWKEWTTKTLGIAWQRDFFEHRIRKEESVREKADYILSNPVRAGLVESPEEWPYVFIAEQRDG